MAAPKQCPSYDVIAKTSMQTAPAVARPVLDVVVNNGQQKRAGLIPSGQCHICRNHYNHNCLALPLTLSHSHCTSAPPELAYSRVSVTGTGPGTHTRLQWPSQIQTCTSTICRRSAAPLAQVLGRC